MLFYIDSLALKAPASRHAKAMANMHRKIPVTTEFLISTNFKNSVVIMKRQYRNTVKKYYMQKDGELKRYFITVEG